MYSRGGKTDLYVNADAIDDGTNPPGSSSANANGGEGAGQTAVGAFAQLRRYLKAKDSAALLIFFSNRKDGDRVRALALEAMIDAGAIPTDDSPRAGWPCVRWSSGAQQVTLCVAVVDLWVPPELVDAGESLGSDGSRRPEHAADS